MGDFVFATCEQLEKVNLGQIDSITHRCFINCGKLRFLFVPDTVYNIDSSPFDGCGNLNNIYYNGTKEQWNDIYKADDWYRGLPETAMINCTDGTIFVYD